MLHLLLTLQCHQVVLVALQVGVAEVHLLIGILFVVILVVIIHKFLAKALKELRTQLTLQNKSVEVVAELFKEDNRLTASALLCSRTALLQYLSHALVETVTVVHPLVQTATLQLLETVNLGLALVT